MRRLAAVLALAVVSLGLTAVPASAAALAVTDLTGALEPADLAQDLAGEGVTIDNVTFVGTDTSAGRFTSGLMSVIGFDQGIALSTGNVNSVVGPNVQDGTTGFLGTGGDEQLTELAGVPTFDKTVLEFDFTPDDDTVFFSYVFTSEEYNEFVNGGVNDTFGFFVNGTNCATADGDPVSINTVNNGNPFGVGTPSHPELYRNNDLEDGGGAIDTEMDGLTVILVCEAPVIPNEANHMKLAIADGGDTALDSNVFIRAGSFGTVPPENCTDGIDNDEDGLIDGADPDCATDLAVGIDAPTALTLVDCAYSPNPFTVVATVTNDGSVAASGVVAALELPAGLNLVTGDVEQTIGALGPGASQDVTWTVSADLRSEAADLVARVVASGTGLDDATRDHTISVPAMCVANTPPVADSQSLVTEAGVPVEITLGGEDPEGAPISFAIATGPTFGTLSTITGDKVTYTPNAGFEGVDSFTFTASDGELPSAPATVTITVEPIPPPVNRPPVVRALELETERNQALPIRLSASDPDGDALTLEIVGGPANGTLALGAAPNVTYTPRAGFTGTDSFTYRASDGELTSSVATVTIRVVAPPPPPPPPPGPGPTGPTPPAPPVPPVVLGGEVTRPGGGAVPTTPTTPPPPPPPPGRVGPRALS